MDGLYKELKNVSSVYLSLTLNISVRIAKSRLRNKTQDRLMTLIRCFWWAAMLAMSAQAAQAGVDNPMAEAPTGGGGISDMALLAGFVVGLWLAVSAIKSGAGAVEAWTAFILGTSFGSIAGLLVSCATGHS